MYHTTKRIKGKRYHYLQRSRRDGKKVKTDSYYVGPVGAPYGVLKLGFVMAMDKARRDRFVAEVEFKDPPKQEAPKVDGLGFKSDWNAVGEFQHESGIKSAGESAILSSDAGELSSGQASATPSAE